jgi:glycogen debranching enzyme
MRKLLLVLSLFTSIHAFGQTLSADNNSISDAFKLAVSTVDVNTRRGILAAGADYGGDWTRDIAINSWNGISLLRPQIAYTSLWSVTINKDTIGLQYWDKIIWVVAAYNHYRVTGDKEFLKQAYACSAKTMKQLEQQTFDKNYGLFKGPSVFNDGIAGYPEPVYEPSNYSSGVVDHKGSVYIKCLSTNCIYYGAYLALIEMAKAVKADKAVIADYQQRSTALKSNILKHLYDAKTNTFNYLIDQNGNINNSQEGLGISFAVIFGVVDGEQAKQVISHAVVSKYGITSIYPDFPRYSHDKPGRHNNIIWPMVNGFFAKAAITAKDYSTFANELYAQTHLALDEDKGDYNFREIYNPYTGKPDGGWQANGPDNPQFRWASCKMQTWSATAYISMILNGVVGMRFSENSLAFAPYLPEGLGHIELKDLAYRNATLDISIKGKGNIIKSFALDGKAQKDHEIASTIQGKHNVIIELE